MVTRLPYTVTLVFSSLSWYNSQVMVISTETKTLLKKLGIKLGLGILGFTAAFISDNVGLFDIHPVVAAAIVALLDDVAEWINHKGQIASRVAHAVKVATGRN